MNQAGKRMRVSQWARRQALGGLFVPLGEKVRLLRKELGWSQDELAVKVESTADQISRYEHGKITPSTEMVVKMAKSFDVSLDYLLIDGSPRRPLGQVDDEGFFNRIGDLTQLPEDDRESVLRILDALLTKNKLRSLAGGAGSSI